MSLERWFDRFASSDPDEWDVHRRLILRGDAYALPLSRRWVKLLRSRLEQLAAWHGNPPASLVKAFVWNVQYAAQRIAWDAGYFGLPLEDGIQLIDSLPEALAFACQRAGSSGGVLLFWEFVVGHKELWGTDDSVPAITDAILSALERQLATGNACCQESALHGLFHLNDPRGDALVARYRGTFATVEARRYADAILASARLSDDHF